MSASLARIGIITAIAALILPIFAYATLSRNLKVGDTGPDVRELQQFLNRDPETIVASLGPGSPGNETEYFGALTEGAVKRLQQKYASEILAPIGLTSPTGYVGAQTRSFISRASSSLPPPPTPPPSLSTKPVISSVTPLVITKSPQEITLTGTGFTSFGNTVVTSTELPNAFVGIPSNDGKTLKFNYAFGILKIIKDQALQSSTATVTPQDLLDIFSKSIINQTTGTTTSKIPLILQVKNANGESNTVPLQLDMKSLLTN